MIFPSLTPEEMDAHEDVSYLTSFLCRTQHAGVNQDYKKAMEEVILKRMLTTPAGLTYRVLQTVLREVKEMKGE